MTALKHLRMTATAGLFVLGSAVGFSTSALAATATASASVDWATLLVTHLGGGAVTFDAISGTQLDESEAEAGADFELGSALIWDGSFADAVDVSGLNSANSVAFTPPAAALEQLIFSSSSASAVDIGAVSSDSSASRQGEFDVEGDGVVVIQLGYSLFSEALGNLADASANSRATVHAVMRNLSSPGSGVSTSSAVVATVFDLGAYLDGNTSDNAVIAVALFFNNGDRGFFDITVSTEAAASMVPVPAGVWLLGMPLIMLLRRRA